MEDIAASRAEAVAKTLKEPGIKRIFGLPGGEIPDLTEACRRMRNFIWARHESIAALIIDVTGQMTRTAGGCLSTVGPGPTNLVRVGAFQEAMNAQGPTVIDVPIDPDE
jgi:thiamine pyrophosphate-dependent acetolactate synthase large subunit-like protein